MQAEPIPDTSPLPALVFHNAGKQSAVWVGTCAGGPRVLHERVQPVRRGGAPQPVQKGRELVYIPERGVVQVACSALKVGENSLDFHAEGHWQESARAAGKHSFFHWDLEFPGIFYGRDGLPKESPGFDAVVGNPPYVRQEMIAYKEALQASTRDLDGARISSRTDLSGYFYYCSLKVLREFGRLGFITSDGWMNTGYGRSLQKTLLRTRIVAIMKTRFNIFQADTKTVTLVLDKSKAGTSHSVEIIYINDKKEFASKMKSTKKRQKDLVGNNWNIYFNALNFVPKTSVVLMSEMGKVKFGTKTGHKKFFVLSSYDVAKYNISEKYRAPLVTNAISSRQLQHTDAVDWLLDVNQPKNTLTKTTDGKRVLRYIERGEDMDAVVPGGKDRATIKISQLPSVKKRKLWYSLSLAKPPAILLSRLINDKVKIYENNGRFHAINTFVYFTPTDPSHTHAFLAYFSSSLFSLYLEQNGHPMGGGALSVETIDYKRTLVPNFDLMPKDDLHKISGAWNEYCHDGNLNRLDQTVLSILKFQPHTIQQIREQVDILRNRRMKRVKPR